MIKIAAKELQKHDSRCNISIDFVAHRVTETAREQEQLRPHTLQWQAAEMEHWLLKCKKPEMKQATILRWGIIRHAYQQGPPSQKTTKCGVGFLQKCENNDKSLTATLTVEKYCTWTHDGLVPFLVCFFTDLSSEAKNENEETRGLRSNNFFLYEMIKQ